MVRGVLFSLVLSGLLVYAIFRMDDLYQQATPERITRVDIYDKEIAYRTSTYASASLLRIGLQAAQDPPKMVGLHDCSRTETFEEVVDVLRELGYGSFEVEWPEDC